MLCLLYMIFTDSGIILLRQDFRETDRIVSLYTQEHGRLNARVPGVSHAKGKLKALCEPFVCADYRIYVRRGGVIGTLTGGKVQSVFPTIRRDIKRIQLALRFCELMVRLTPLHQPSPEKFELLKTAFEALETGPISPAFSAAFTLRLMMLAGYGLDHPVLQISTEFWQKMHEAPFTDLQFSTPEDLLALGKCNNVCRRFLDRYLTYPLNTTKNMGLEETNLPWDSSAPETAYPTEANPILQPVP